MARKPNKYDPDTISKIQTLTTQGASAETVAAQTGIPARTARRLQAKLRGSAKAQASKGAALVAAPKVEEVPDEVPEGTPVEQIDRWIKILERNATKAEASGNLAALASIMAKITALAALKQRATPSPKADPNERPDYLELAREGEKRFLTLLENTLKHVGVTSP